MEELFTDIIPSGAKRNLWISITLFRHYVTASNPTILLEFMSKYHGIVNQDP